MASAIVNSPRSSADLGEEHGFEQEVAELLAQVCRTAALDRLEHLVGFLEDERPQRGLGLLAVPRTPVGRSQRPHDVDQPVEPFARPSSLRQRIRPVPGTSRPCWSFPCRPQCGRARVSQTSSRCPCPSSQPSHRRCGRPCLSRRSPSGTARGTSGTCRRPARGAIPIRCPWRAVRCGRSPACRSDR